MEIKKSILGNIEVPKHDDYRGLIATKESVKVGDFFIDGSERLSG